MTRNRNILLVEDNPDDVELTLRAFKRSQIANNITVARDGLEALTLLGLSGAGHPTVSPALPEVVLLDLKLPKVDGIGVLRQIKSNERTRRLPVVILTSSLEESDLAQCYDLGCNSYVRKPVDFADFLEAAKHLGLYWLVLNELP